MKIKFIDMYNNVVKAKASVIPEDGCNSLSMEIVLTFESMLSTEENITFSEKQVTKLYVEIQKAKLKHAKGLREKPTGPEPRKVISSM